MKKINKYILILSVILGFTACQKDYEVGGTSTEALAGDWWVEMGISDGAGGFDGDTYGYYNLSTFNTALNQTDSMWLTDNETFWSYKVKVAVDVNNLTFAVANGTDLLYDDNTTITNGKIIPGGTTSPSGVKTDAIYFEVEWASDPGTIYVAKGYRYTGWPEDDH